MFSNNSDGGSSTGGGGTPTPNGTSAQVLFSTSNNPLAPSTANLVSVKAGSSYTVAVGFVTDTGGPLASLNVKATGSNSLATLPTGWALTGSSSTAAPNSPNFTNVAAGSGSQLFLTFSPSSSSQSGIVYLDYTSTLVGGGTTTGTLSIPYQGTDDSNVYGISSTPIQVVANANASGANSTLQTVLVNFASETGSFTNPPINLLITSGLNTLPAGVSSPSPTFFCNTVTNGCALPITIDSSALTNSSQTVTLNYSYQSNDSGPVNKTGTVDIPIIKTSGNTLISTVNSGAGIVVGAVGSSQVVPVSFATSDNSLATNFSLSGYLPAGWATTTGGPIVSYSSNQVAGAGTNSATFNLIYTPTAGIPGVLSFPLTTTSTSSNGVVKTGAVNVQYTTTAASSNNLLYSTNVFGQVGTPVGGSQPINVSFTTDSGKLATGITLNSGDLATLASQGITQTSPFTCASVGSEPCTATFAYSPTGVNFSGVGILNLTYIDQNGVTQPKVVNIFASSTTQNHVNATVSSNLFSATSNITAAISTIQNPQTPQTVTVTFNTDQGTAAGLTVPSFTLPSGWTLQTPASFPLNCSSVFSTGTGCQLVLQYNPTTNISNSNLSFNYPYTPNGGPAVTGTVSINYSASPAAQPTQPDLLPYRYFTPADGFDIKKIKKCPINADGTVTLFSLCTIAVDTEAGLPPSPAIQVNTTYRSLHVASFTTSNITKKFVYLMQTAQPQQMVRCTMNSSGDFDASTCNYTFLPDNTLNIAGFSSPALGIARTGDGNTYLYFKNAAGTNQEIRRCLLDSDSTLPTTGNASGCMDVLTQTTPTIPAPISFEFTYDANNNANRIYITSYNGAQSQLFSCALDSDGSSSDNSTACTTGMALPSELTNPGASQQIYALKIKDGYAFISARGVVLTGRIFRCAIQPDGTFGPTPNTTCTSTVSYQGIYTFGLYPTEMQLYPNTNYIYISNNDNTFAPTICQIDTTQPGGIVSFGNTGACVSVGPPHNPPTFSNAFPTNSMF